MYKRILILANSSGGLYNFRHELIEKMLEKSQVYISVPNGEKIHKLVLMGCKFIDINIDRRGINLLTDLKLLFRYKKVIRKVNPDLVVTYTIKPNIYGGFICRMYKKQYAVNITGLGTTFQKKNILHLLVSTMYRFTLKKAKVVFFENSANRDVLINEKLLKQNQCCVLNGAGVNLEHYYYATYPQDEKTTRFLFVGRVMKEKGVEELFAAMKRLVKEDISCTLDVLGNYEENYKETIKNYEKEGWLHYHGYQVDVRPFIEKAHCFVLPSWHEGMANTNLESAAMGRPIITSNIPGCKEAVVVDKSGFLCEKQEVESLYLALKKFVFL